MLNRYLVAIMCCFNIVLHAFDYDLIVIGAGTAGTHAALLAADLGKRVALIDKYPFDEDRVTTYDVPYRVLFNAAARLRVTEQMQPFLKLHQNMCESSLFEYIKDMCQTIGERVQQAIAAKKNIKQLFGSVQFVDPYTITLDDFSMTAQNFFIATGARSYTPYIEGVDTVPYVTAETFFSKQQLPKSMIILGGGPLTVELALALQIFGVSVTVISPHAIMFPTFDYEVSELLTAFLMQRGIQVICNCTPVCVKEGLDDVSVVICNKAGLETVHTAEQLFLAMGLDPNVEGLHLENAGVQLHSKTDNHTALYGKFPMHNAILVNPFLQSTMPHIYAGGDVIGTYAVNRPGAHHATLAIHNMLLQDEKNSLIDYTNMPKFVCAADMDFASVGLTEQEALKKYNGEILIYRSDYYTSPRACIEGNQGGFTKCICTKQGVLLGVHAFGKHARETINTLYIGQQFNELYKEYGLDKDASFDYPYILYQLSLQCSSDVGIHRSPNIMARIFAWIRGYM